MKWTTDGILIHCPHGHVAHVEYASMKGVEPMQAGASLGPGVRCMECGATFVEETLMIRIETGPWSGEWIQNLIRFAWEVETRRTVENLEFEIVNNEQ